MHAARWGRGHEGVRGRRVGSRSCKRASNRGLVAIARYRRPIIDQAIEHADDETIAVAAARELPTGVCALVASGADATKVGRVVGSSIDALTRRLLSFAAADLGDAPVPWAWLALGSEARLEQALHTDQDHALAYDPGDRTPEELDPYFAALAERVTAGLESAGIPRCDGDAMAVHPGLRRPIDSWAEAYRTWMSDPSMDGSILSSIAFDFRQVAGPLDVEPSLHAVMATAPRAYPQFLRHLTRRALDCKPPTGFMRNFVVEGKGEHEGRSTSNGAVWRSWPTSRGRTRCGRQTREGNPDRLRPQEATGQMDAERRRRSKRHSDSSGRPGSQHQVRQVENGDTPDDFVDPEHLGPIARFGLKEAFRIDRAGAADARVRPGRQRLSPGSAGAARCPLDLRTLALAVPARQRFRRRGCARERAVGERGGRGRFAWAPSGVRAGTLPEARRPQPRHPRPRRLHRVLPRST